ncbi:hypothetical protein Ancab_004083 [Ancistrocladus abbreviatus]
MVSAVSTLLETHQAERVRRVERMSNLTRKLSTIFVYNEPAAALCATLVITACSYSCRIANLATRRATRGRRRSWGVFSRHRNQRMRVEMELEADCVEEAISYTESVHTRLALGALVALRARIKRHLTAEVAKEMSFHG